MDCDNEEAAGKEVHTNQIGAYDVTRGKSLEKEGALLEALVKLTVATSKLESLRCSGRYFEYV